MSITNNESPIGILLADDDIDDRFFFDMALKEMSFPTKLATTEDGEKLMSYLLKNTKNLPDVLFLDLNMPRKNGAECLLEIKLNNQLKHLQIIVYSTSVHENIADMLYKNGASYYILKRDFLDLVEILRHVFSLMNEKKIARPTRDKFIMTIIP
jgi:DNA-binding NarL/FixJ family response regulator